MCSGRWRSTRVTRRRAGWRRGCRRAPGRREEAIPIYSNPNHAAGSIHAPRYLPAREKNRRGGEARIFPVLPFRRPRAGFNQVVVGIEFRRVGGVIFSGALIPLGTKRNVAEQPPRQRAVGGLNGGHKSPMPGRVAAERVLNPPDRERPV